MKNPQRRFFVLALIIIFALFVAVEAYIYLQQGSANYSANKNATAQQSAKAVSNKANTNSGTAKNSSLTVLYPTSGALYTGQQITVTWSPGNAVVSKNVVSIQLVTLNAKNKTGCPGYQAGPPGSTYDCRYYTLLSDTPNTGSARWTVGKTATGDAIPPGNYYMRIYLSQMGTQTVQSLQAQGHNFETYTDSYITIIK